jgi:hypothetical protein
VQNYALFSILLFFFVLFEKNSKDMLKTKPKHRTFFRNLFYTILIAIGAVLVIVYFLPRGSEFNYQFDLNKPWRYGQLIATFDFPIYKDETIVKKEQDSLQIHFQPYFDVHQEIADNEIKDMLQSVETKNIPSTYRLYLARALDHIYQTGVISNEDKNWFDTHRTISFMLIKDKIAIEKKVDSIYTVKEAYQYLSQGSANIDHNILLQCDLEQLHITQS